MMADNTKTDIDIINSMMKVKCLVLTDWQFVNDNYDLNHVERNTRNESEREIVGISWAGEIVGAMVTVYGVLRWYIARRDGTFN